MRNRSLIVKILQSLAAAGLLLAVACDDSSHVFNPTPVVVHGDGSVREETRAIGSFTRIDLQGVGVLKIQQGAREELVIRAEGNLLEYLQAEVSGGELLIWKDAVTLFNTRPIEYQLTVVDLERVALTGGGGIEGSNLDTGPLTLRFSGAGSIELDDLNAPSVDVESSGVGNVTLSGSVQEQTIELNGMGNYDGRDLDSAEADVRLTYGGSATVRVRDRLDVTIDWSGSVYYIGDPVITSDIGGSGELVKIAG